MAVDAGVGASTSRVNSARVAVQKFGTFLVDGGLAAAYVTPEG